MGAVARDVVIENAAVIHELGIPSEFVKEAASREFREIERREQLYRGDRPQPDLNGATVILVDDGLATGSTMRAAVSAARRMGAAHVVVAVPVGSSRACGSLAQADDVICLETPRDFSAVGEWYEDFSQVTDAEVRDLLARTEPVTPHAK